METLQLLGTALGLATLAGINLYLTVFITGLAIRLDWITLAERYAALDILAHPAIITIAGVLYFIEFFADKIPWLDSVWDSVHTLLRPVGGTLLAIQVLGNSDPVFEVIVALLASGMSLVAHGVKAGSRVVVNASPEPFSNIAVSFGEDVGVLGGLWLLYVDPLITLILCILFVGISAWFAPKIFSAVRLKLWLAWKKLNQPATDDLPTRLPDTLPVDESITLAGIQKAQEPIAWAVRCVSNKGHRLPAGRFGYLVGTGGGEPFIYFVSGTGWRSIARVLDLRDFQATKESKFLTENLVLYKPDGRNRTTFLFDRSSAKLVETILTDIQSRTTPQENTTSPEPLPENEEALAMVAED